MLTFGLIGAGRIAGVHAASIAANPRARLSAVYDPFEAAATTLADKYGIRTVGSVEELLGSSDVDAVVICSPTPQHVEHVVAAAKAGKPALCEKPIAQDTRRAAELARLLEGTHPLVQVGFNRRFDPSFAKMHRLVQDGAIGTLEQLTIISRDPQAPSRDYIAKSGGIFRDMTIHDFDTVRFFLGDIVSVSAVGQHLDPSLADTGDFDGALLTLANEKGQCATIINSRHCATGYDQRIEAFGPKGAISADNVRPTSLHSCTTEHSDAADPYLDFFLERYHDAYARELDAFLDAVQSSTTPSPSLEDGAAALQLAEAAAQSAQTGRVVRTDPASLPTFGSPARV